MPEYTTVAKVGDIAEGQASLFTIGARMVAVFRSDDQYYALDDLCPHMGASLSTGHLEDGVVTCPWHAWRFRVCDGTWVDNPRLKVGAYEVRLDGDRIQVAMPEDGDEKPKNE